MKQVILFTLMLLLLLTGCKEPPVTPSPSSGAEPPTAPSSVTTSSPESPVAKTVDLPLSGDEIWTWNELYDYLENPRLSGEFFFDQDQGETIALLDTDGKTSLSNQWSLPLKENMLVIHYNQKGDIIGKYRIVFTGMVSSKPSPPPVVSSAPTPSNPANSSDISAPQQQKQLLTLYVGVGDASLEKAVAAFNKQSKTTELLIIEGAGLLTAEHLEKLTKENNCPDLVIMNHREMILAGKSKQLRNLSNVSFQKEFDPALLKHAKLSSALYGLPIGGVTTCLACNDELLYRAKATVPTTYQELMENAKLLRDTLTGVTPLGLTTDIADASSMANEFTLFLNGFGGCLFAPDFQSTSFYSEAGANVLGEYQLLQQEKLIADYTIRKDFYNQTVGYGIVASTDYEKTFGKKAKANFTAAPLVAPGSSSAVSTLDLYSFCVPVAGKSTEGALEFLSFYFQSPEHSVAFCQKQGLVPSLLEAQNDTSYQTEAWQVLIQAAKTAAPTPPIACYTTVETYLAECVSSVLSGIDKEIALEKAWNKTENRLARE